MIQTCKVELLIMMGLLCIGSHVEVVCVAILFNIHYTQMVGSLRLGATCVVCVEQFQYTG